MRSLLALTLAVLAGPAAAAPAPKLINVELDNFDTTFSFQNPLPAATVDPGGLYVPPTAVKEWLQIGLLPGDVIRYCNGTAVSDHFFILEGITVVDLVRQGKPVILHLDVHGKAAETVDVAPQRFHELLDTIAKGGIGTPVQRDGTPTGVRMTELLVSMYIHIDIGDVVRSVGGTAIHTDAELVAALQALPVGSTQILVDRDGRHVVLTIKRAAPLALEAIKNKGKNHFELPHALAKALADEPRMIEEGVTLIPVAKDGAIHGHKLIGIAAESIVAALGLTNDDIVLDINDKPLDTMEQAYQRSSDLENEPVLTVHIERKGKPLTLTYNVVAD